MAVNQVTRGRGADHKPGDGAHPQPDDFKKSVQNAQARRGAPGGKTAQLFFEPPLIPPVAPPLTPPSNTDAAVHAWLRAMGPNLTQADKDQLAKIGDDATRLLNFFNSHSRGDPTLNKPPAAVAKAETYLLSIQSIRKQLANNPNGSLVTRDSLGKFLDSLDSAAKSATTNWQTFENNNPGLSGEPIARQQAVDASILEANLPVLDTAGLGSTADGKITAADLKAVNSLGQVTIPNTGIQGVNPGTLPGLDSMLPSALKSAARLYANPGEFDVLSHAGLDPSAKHDGYFDDASLAADVGTASTNVDGLSSLQLAALHQVVDQAGGDPSKVTAAYFENPAGSNATAADKAALLLQLEETMARYKAGMSVYKPVFRPGDQVPNQSPVGWHNAGNPGPTPGQQQSAFMQKIQNDIGILSHDKSIAALLQKNEPAALKAIVKSDPKIEADVHQGYKNDSSAFNFSGVMQSEQGLNTTKGVATFVSEATRYAQALGIKPDLRGAFAGLSPALQKRVLAGYHDITSGDEIHRLMNQGLSLHQAILQSSTDKTFYERVLPHDLIEKASQHYSSVVAKDARDQIMRGKSAADILKGLGITGANDPALATFIKKHMDILAGPHAPPSTAGAIVQVVSAAMQFIREGHKFDDSMNKAFEQWKLGAGAGTQNYKIGVFHAASGILMLGAMGIGIAGKQDGLATTQQALQSVGLLAEGGSKFYRKVLLKPLQNQIAHGEKQIKNEQNPGVKKSLRNLVDQDKAKLASFQVTGEDVLNIGKGLGLGAGSAVGVVFGALSLKEAIASGDTAGIGFDSALIGQNGLALIGGVGEVGTYLAKRFGTQVAGESGEVLAESEAAAGEAGTTVGEVAGETVGVTLEEAAGAFGAISAVAGVAGGVIAVADLIYTLVNAIKIDNQRAADAESWYNLVQQGVAPTGIKPPSEEISLLPKYGYTDIPDVHPPV